MRALLLGIGILACASAQAQNISLNAKQQAALRELVATDAKAKWRYNPLKKEADKALAMAPKPTATVRSAGLLMGDPEKTAGTASFQDMKKIQALCFAWIVTLDDKYAAKIRDYASRWASINQPPTDSVDGNHYEYLLVGYDLVRLTFAEDERKRIDDWFRLFAKRQQEGKGTSRAPNNRESTRLKTVGMIGFMLSDQALINYAVEGYKVQIARGVEPDGSTYDFHERDALYYHINDIRPLLTLARVADQNGVSLYSYTSPEGTTLGKTIDFLLPYVQKEKTHAEFANSRIAFDKKRAANGEANFQAGRKFDPDSAVSVLEAASYFRPDLAKVIAQATDETNKVYPDALALWIAAARKGK